MSSGKQPKNVPQATSRFKCAAENVRRGLRNKSSLNDSKSGCIHTSTPSANFMKDDIFAMPPVDQAVTMVSTVATNRESQKFKSSYSDQACSASQKESDSPQESSDESYDGSEEELELAYAEYLQAKFLESRAKLALKERTENALAQIHEVWCLIQSTLAQEKEVDLNLQIVSHLEKIHQILCTQDEMLKSALEVLPGLLNMYENIAESVDAMHHKLAISSVKPLVDSEVEGEILQLTERLKATLDEIINTHCDKSITKSANLYSAFSMHSEDAMHEVQSGAKLLPSVSDLVISETSLKMGAEQMSEAEQ